MCDTSRFGNFVSDGFEAIRERKSLEWGKKVPSEQVTIDNDGWFYQSFNETAEAARKQWIMSLDLDGDVSYADNYSYEGGSFEDALGQNRGNSFRAAKVKINGHMIRGQIIDFEYEPEYRVLGFTIENPLMKGEGAAEVLNDMRAVGGVKLIFGREAPRARAGE